jgi:hypothetical protein
MQQLLSIIGAATALASATQTGIATNAPVSVSTCAVNDLVNPASYADLGPPISYRALRLSFVNGQDAVATQVVFDVERDGERMRITDRGRFSRGVTIEHVFGGIGSLYGGGTTTCTVAAVTFADGTAWTASAGVASRDRAFRPDYSHALTVEQMTKAWNDEWNRIDPPVVTGGG